MSTIKEDQYTEFKSSFNDAVIETLTAFANTRGGKIIIGVENKGPTGKRFYGWRRVYAEMGK